MTSPIDTPLRAQPATRGATPGAWLNDGPSRWLSQLEQQWLALWGQHPKVDASPEPARQAQPDGPRDVWPMTSAQGASNENAGGGLIDRAGHTDLGSPAGDDASANAFASTTPQASSRALYTPRAGAGDVRAPQVEATGGSARAGLDVASAVGSQAASATDAAVNQAGVQASVQLLSPASMGVRAVAVPQASQDVASAMLATSTAQLSSSTSALVARISIPDEGSASGVAFKATTAPHKISPSAWRVAIHDDQAQVTVRDARLSPLEAAKACEAIVQQLSQLGVSAKRVYANGTLLEWLSAEPSPSAEASGTTPGTGLDVAPAIPARGQPTVQAPRPDSPISY